MQKHVLQADWTFLENVIRLGLKSNLTSRDEIEKKLRSLRKKIEIAKKEGDLEGLAGIIISKNGHFLYNFSALDAVTSEV